MHDDFRLCEQSVVYLSSGIGQSVGFHVVILGTGTDFRCGICVNFTLFLWPGWNLVFYADVGLFNLFNLSRRNRRDDKSFETGKGGVRG